MNESVRSAQTLWLAAKYVWWTPPDVVVSEGMPRLVASVMEMAHGKTPPRSSNALDLICLGKF